MVGDLQVLVGEFLFCLCQGPPEASLWLSTEAVPKVAQGTEAKGLASLLHCAGIPWQFRRLLYWAQPNSEVMDYLMLLDYAEIVCSSTIYFFLSALVFMYIIFYIFFYVYLERGRKQAGEGQIRGDRIPSRLGDTSSELDVGLELIDCEIMTQAKIKSQTESPRNSYISFLNPNHQ